MIFFQILPHMTISGWNALITGTNWEFRNPTLNEIWQVKVYGKNNNNKNKYELTMHFFKYAITLAQPMSTKFY